MATTAASIRKYRRFFDMRNVKRVLDYGAGKLRNADFLAEHGFEVYAADVPEQVRRILESDRAKRLAGVLPVELLDRTHLNVDLVLSTYVLNIIPDGTE